MNNFPSYNLFGKPRLPGRILYDRSTLGKTPSPKGFSIPLVIDTEFQTFQYHWSKGGQQTRTGITTQAKGIHHQAKPLILEHYGLGVNRHPVATSGFHPVDYLVNLGYPVSIRRTSDRASNLPVVEFVLYAHFALAEALMIVNGAYSDDFERLFQQKDPSKPRFEMKRHLVAITPSFEGRDLDRVLMPWILSFGDDDFRVAISWKDTGAIHGLASYAKFCEASGHKLDAKSLLNEHDKKQMLQTYVQKPEDYDRYAVGDLEVYEALEKNTANFRKIYESLGIGSKFKDPKLTIGSTVKDLFLAKLHCYYAPYITSNESEKEWKNFIDESLESASAQFLRKQNTQTSAILAKVEGGRCRNNRPTASYIESLIIDLDISGCYGEGQRNQLYFVGKPCKISFPAKTGINEYISLRKFLKEWGDRLIPGAWFARVSTTKTLTYAQDFLASWYVGGKSGEDIMAKYVEKMSSDTEDIECDNNDFDEEDGTVKILNYEIHNGTVTSDFIEWLYNVCSCRQRNELLDNLVVKAAIYYDATQRVDNLKNLKETYEKHTSKNKVYLKGSKIIFEDGECHAWVGFNLGEMLVNDLLCNRKLHPKKTPLNELFKLCVNTLYGDMTSKYFISANVVVGNNITARARALAWYMEKGLNGFQTITDGCAFELNKVTYPYQKKQLTSERLVNLYMSKYPEKERSITLKPLASFDEIRILEPEQEQNELNQVKLVLIKDKVETYLSIDEAYEWINKESLKHLQSIFSKVSVLHEKTTAINAFKNNSGNAEAVHTDRIGQFSFEVKYEVKDKIKKGGWYTKGCFHGSANYHLWSNTTDSGYKFRSYETKKIHESVSINLEGEIIVSTRYNSDNNPAIDFMDQLQNPCEVKRQEPFVKDSILKPGDYLNRLETYKQLEVYPGDTYLKTGLLREFSLSQFTFRTLKQRTAWEKFVESSKEKYGQSVERFFLNDDGTLNYQAMIKAVDKLISSGCDRPREVLRESQNRDKENLAHNYQETLDRVKEYLAKKR